jgi:hypothetical protein
VFGTMWRGVAGQPTGWANSKGVCFGVSCNPCTLASACSGFSSGRNLDVTPSAKGGRIRIGPAGWSYKDWAGVVYPAPKPRGFDPLRYVAGYFDTVEINSTFYRPALLVTLTAGSSG